ncbi:Tetrapyrrole biosynthesis regulator FLU [Macleaya cordata]|uniref:Tetrapyrrole biosynthesis regulator FLU n=1 Tax=Macleaya cordata TaxID=56857 RepID=A0A200QCU2_MACCD|nr:Tetrapyrrole biosynthesis regulator FLU [Macleaya cordata]
MAIVVHCSFSSSCSHLDDISQRSRPFPTLSTGIIHASEKVASYLRLKGENFVLSSADGSRRTNIPFAIRHILSCSQTLHSGLDDLQMTESEETCDFVQRLPGYGNDVAERIFAYQRMAPIKYPLMAFSVANALMLTLPLEALAATCEAKSSLLDMPVLLSVALVGATVGGLLARQRRGELERLNDQLRQINAALRRQAKIESYAPTLRYAPVGSRISENEVIVDSRKQELISRLKTGKNFLRNQDLEKAFVEFNAALELAQNLKDPIEEKKAARGLDEIKVEGSDDFPAFPSSINMHLKFDVVSSGASLQRQRKYREAIKYHSMVLAISERIGEDSGNTEAYGAIADCYTELGDLERAAIFYDKYIARLETD